MHAMTCSLSLSLLPAPLGLNTNANSLRVCLPVLVRVPARVIRVQRAVTSANLGQWFQKVTGTATLEKEAEEATYLTYDENKSVFPAEACEELGGDSCDPSTGREIRLPPQAVVEAAVKPGPDIETMAYDGPKTVFPGEACDDLGGEFCEPDYQENVGKDQ
eukprot:TRINITY_DN33457_c0_g1_i1.p1 TRINITY_DN33457_c0_g1~~TRINITY_DN33457_c0_g1_i1.p1  ORF type:complete len:161 (-),score=12.49 TRINITY_DN33457_c0_g1_i1:472-954(-)